MQLLTPKHQSGSIIPYCFFLKDIVKARPSTGNFTVVMISELANVSAESSREHQTDNAKSSLNTRIDENLEIPPSQISTEESTSHEIKDSVFASPTSLLSNQSRKRTRKNSSNYIEKQKPRYLKSNRTQDKKENRLSDIFQELAARVKKIPDTKKLAL